MPEVRSFAWIPAPRARVIRDTFVLNGIGSLQTAARWLSSGLVFTLILRASLGAVATPTSGDANGEPHSIRLRAAIESALRHNRTLQIERGNPEIARLSLSMSYGHYDPSLTSQVRRENVSDSGAFDPANPAVDTGFDSESTVTGIGLGGFLPLGGLYNLGGTYGHSTGSRNFLNFDSYRVNASIFLQQPLLKNSWIDLPRLTIRVNKRNLEISEEGVRFVAMDVINQVQQSYFDLAAAWDTLRARQDLLETREKLLRGIQHQVEVGMLTPQEEKVAHAQRATALTDLILTSNAVALAGNNLKTLMGNSGPTWDEQLLRPLDPLVAVSEPFDLNTSWQQAIARRPDLVQLMKEVEKASLNLKFRRNQLFPAVDLIGSYGRRGANAVQAFPPDKPVASAGEAFGQIGSGDAPSDMIGVMLTVPLMRTSDRAQYRIGKELKKQAELLVKQKEELILREISDAIHTARFGLDRVRAARRAVEFAEAALAAEEQKLTGGRSSIIFVLQFQTDLVVARAAEIQARADYNKAVSQLHFAEGRLLERSKVELEFR
jgi:outer membrane protein TolC